MACTAAPARSAAEDLAEEARDHQVKGLRGVVHKGSLGHGSAEVCTHRSGCHIPRSVVRAVHRHPRIEGGFGACPLADAVIASADFARTPVGEPLGLSATSPFPETPLPRYNAIATA